MIVIVSFVPLYTTVSFWITINCYSICNCIVWDQSAASQHVMHVQIAQWVLMNILYTHICLHLIPHLWLAVNCGGWAASIRKDMWRLSCSLCLGWITWTHISWFHAIVIHTSWLITQSTSKCIYTTCAFQRMLPELDFSWWRWGSLWFWRPSGYLMVVVHEEMVLLKWLLQQEFWGWWHAKTIRLLYMYTCVNVLYDYILCLSHSQSFCIYVYCRVV